MSSLELGGARLAAVMGGDREFADWASVMGTSDGSEEGPSSEESVD